MKIPNRSARAACAPALLLIGLLLVLAGSLPATAQQAAEDSQDSAEAQLTKKEKKERAKQARIDEYLRKKEERRARREQRRLEKERQEAERADDRSPAPSKAAPVAVAADETGKKKKKRSARRSETVRLPKGLARAQETVRSNPLGQDPSVREYLELIDRAEASPHQLAAFGNFLSQNGMNNLALEYYGVALSIERKDPVLWLNVGTLHRQLKEYDQAAGAYSRALSLDPNNAFAHYNLGSVLDEMGEYDDAIEEYRLALTLDPSLGDPATNPQAANNERLLAVKLMLYEQQVGSAGLPLVDVPGGAVRPNDER